MAHRREGLGVDVHLFGLSRRADRRFPACHGQQVIRGRDARPEVPFNLFQRFPYHEASFALTRRRRRQEDHSGDHGPYRLALVTPQRLLIREVQNIEHARKVLVLHQDLAFGEKVVQLVALARYADGYWALARACVMLGFLLGASGEGSDNLINLIYDPLR
jgi:hypothetical protein